MTGAQNSLRGADSRHGKRWRTVLDHCRWRLKYTKSYFRNN